jgi:superfamily II DNA/RNA helicase
MEPVVTSFSHLGVPDDMVRRLHADGIEAPFAIQVQAVPAALEGRDLCGRAPTGSGKTLAFAIPLAVLTAQAQPGHPRALVLTPTRELASQVRDTVLPLAQARGRRVATFYGGTNIKNDLHRLRKGVDIVVATPGRLKDLIERGALHLDAIDLVVIDEADRMADMGFLPEVTRLLDRTPDTRQTLLFSATLDGDVDVLVRRYQTNPVTVEVDAPAEQAGDVRHLFWPTERLDRRAVTAGIARRSGQAIVFTRTKRGADRLAKQLKTDGIRAEAIHGDRSQRQRERALDNFHAGRATTLVATDVAARGIHVDDVAVVIHFDPPASDKDYVHRSGRTGRAGSTGVVVSLVTTDDHATIDGFQRTLDLPLGLHTVDYDHLTADEVPAPVAMTVTAPARSGSANRNGAKRANGNRNGGNGSGSGRKPGGGNRSGGARNRSGNAGGTNSSRNSGSRGKGGSRQRSR